MRKTKFSRILTAALSTVFLAQHAAASTSVDADTERSAEAQANAKRFAYPHTRTIFDNTDSTEQILRHDPGIRPHPSLTPAQNAERTETHSVDIRPLQRDNGIENYYGDIWVDKYRWLEEVDEINPEYAKETDADRERNHAGTLWEHPDNARKLAYLSKVKPEESEVNRWVNAQNAATVQYLENIPYYDQLQQNIASLADYEYLDFESKKDAGNFKYIRLADGYYRLIKKNDDGSETVILNERELSEDGSVRIADRSFNERGNYFAFYSKEGNADSDRYQLNVIDTASGKPVIQPIKRINPHIVSLAWRDNNSFYYIKEEGWPSVMLHRLDRTELNDSIIVKGSDVQATINSVWLHDKKYLVIKASYGNAQNLMFLKNLETDRLIQIHAQKPVDKIKREADFSKHMAAEYVAFDHNDVYIVTTDNSEFGEIAKVNVHNPKQRETLVAPKHNMRIQNAVYQNGHFLINYISDGVSRIVLTDGQGNIKKDLTPGVGGVVRDLVSFEVGKETDGKKSEEDRTEDRNYVSFVYESTIVPRTTYKYSIEEDRFFETKRKDPILFDPTQYTISHSFYSSKDGTQIPIIISHKKGLKLDGSNPTILYGYGGFNVSSPIYFMPNRAAWLEHGGVYAIAFLRGGDEYGTQWHKAGKLLNKMNVFDDFIAASEHLIQQGYTSKNHLSISGASNGGLLVGASMVLRPDLFRVAIPEVGVLDMFRHDKNYRTDYWIAEYGIPEDSKKMYQVLKSYSPYHNVKDGVCYPSTLVMTSKRDDRVTPSHSYKFAAILQEKQACARPTFLFAAEKHGHGPNTPNEREQNWLYSMLFNLHEMGIKTLPAIPPRLPVGSFDSKK